MKLFRMADTLWFRQALAPPLALLSLVYEFVVRLRATFYKWGLAPSESCGALVVSVGNIQAGGTGKTPIVEFLASRWRDRTRLGIVSRGYGRSTRGSQRVRVSVPDGETRDAADADAYGDEPTLLAHRLGPTVPIQVGENRAKAARDLIADEGIPLILLDDGFQHMQLRRSFDFVLIDLSAPSWHFRLLPWGRLREPLAALNRADAIFLTKTESVSEDQLKTFEHRIRRHVDVPMIRFQQSISWESGEAKSLTTEPRREKVIAVAGLARPESFFRMVREHATKPDLVAEIAFEDHHAFCEKDVERILESARSHGVRKVLVTEKDSVKIGPLWPKKSPGEGALEVQLVVSRLEVRPAREFDSEQLELVDEIILGQLPRPKRQTPGPATR